jgi:hypothetical protein
MQSRIRAVTSSTCRNINVLGGRYPMVLVLQFGTPVEGQHDPVEILKNTRE